MKIILTAILGLGTITGIAQQAPTPAAQTQVLTESENDKVTILLQDYVSTVKDTMLAANEKKQAEADVQNAQTASDASKAKLMDKVAQLKTQYKLDDSWKFDFSKKVFEKSSQVTQTHPVQPPAGAPGSKTPPKNTPPPPVVK